MADRIIEVTEQPYGVAISATATLGSIPSHGAGFSDTEAVAVLRGLADVLGYQVSSADDEISAEERKESFAVMRTAYYSHIPIILQSDADDARERGLDALIARGWRPPAIFSDGQGS